MMISRLINKRYKWISSDFLIHVFLFLIIFISKANIINLPYHWDELGAYISPTHWLAEGNLLRVLPGLHPPYTFFGHPPALYLSLAVIYEIFGETIWISHLFAIGFSFLGVSFTYLLANHLFNNRMIAIFASLFLFFTPLYFAQSGMVLGDLPIAAFGVMTVYFMLKKQYIPYLLCSLYLMMTKESSMAIIVAILCYLYYEQKNDRIVFKNIFKYSIPLFVLFAFFLLQKMTTGMMLANPYFNSHSFFKYPTFQTILHNLYNVLKIVFQCQGRIFMTLLILLTLVIKKKTVWKREFTLFLFIFILFIGAFSLIYFLPRYILPTLPYFCIWGAYAVVELVKEVKLQLIIGAIVLIIFIGNFYGTGTVYSSYDSDMQYVDMVVINKKTCKYIENKFSDKKVLSLWPLSVALSKPYLGYVSKPIKVVPINAEFDILLYTLQRIPETKKLEEIIKKENLNLVKKFEKNDKFTEVYTKPEN